MAGVKGRFSEDRDRFDAAVSRPVVAPTTLSADQREAAFIKLLATAVVAYLKDGEEDDTEADPLFEDHSACSNFSSDQSGSLDFEQEEGS